MTTERLAKKVGTDKVLAQRWIEQLPLSYHHRAYGHSLLRLVADSGNPGVGRDHKDDQAEGSRMT